VKVRQSYAEVTATQRRMMKAKEQAEALAQDWYKRAQLALEAGNEELAREALSRKQQQTDEANALKVQIDQQAASIDKLYEGMQMLEKKMKTASNVCQRVECGVRSAKERFVCSSPLIQLH